MVYSCKRESHGVYRQIGDFPHPFIPWDEPAFTIAISFSSIFNFATKGAQGGRKDEFVAGVPPDPERDPLTRKGELMISYRQANLYEEATAGRRTPDLKISAPSMCPLCG